MRCLLLATILAAICCAEEVQPLCNATTQGQLWPDIANTDKQAARQLYQTGELERCGLSDDKYRWEHLSVHIKELEKRAREKAANKRAKRALESD